MDAADGPIVSGHEVAVPKRIMTDSRVMRYDDGLRIRQKYTIHATVGTCRGQGMAEASEFKGVPSHRVQETVPHSRKLALAQFVDNCGGVVVERQPGRLGRI